MKKGEESGGGGRWGGEGFEEGIEMDEEFAHDGGESDFGGLLVGDETLVEGFEDGVEVGSGEGGHVEGSADFMTAAADGAFAEMGAAVLIIGSDPGQGGTLAAIEGAELGHFGQEEEGVDEADAFDRGEHSEPGLPGRLGVDLGAQLPIQGGEA